MKFAASLSKLLAALRASDTNARTEGAAVPAPLIVALEPRIVYDASAASIGAAAAAAQHHPMHAETHAQTHAATTPAAAQNVSATSVATSAGTAAAAAAGTSGSAASMRAVYGFTTAGHTQGTNGDGTQGIVATPRHGYTVASSNDGSVSAATMRTVHGFTDAVTASTDTQVVFIDSNVTDYQTLIAGLPAGTQYVVLSSSTDGLAQIAQYLEQHPGVSSIHLVSHGADGEIQVGSTWLNEGDLSAYSAELAQIGAAMKPGGDFLIYGCDVAQEADGQLLVQQIASITHLNVAASTTAVGAASLGGSWSLDYDVGDVTTSVIFSQASEAKYADLLGQTVETYDAYANGGNGETIASYVTSFTLDGLTYTTDGAVLTGVFTSNQGAPLSTSSSDGVLMINQPGDTPMTEVTITLANGDPMAVTSFDFDEGLSNGTIELLPNGSATGEITLSGSQLSGHIDLSSYSQFKDVSSIEILDVGDTGYFTPSLNNFTYVDLSSPPALTASGGSSAFTAADNATSTPVTVDSGITLTDGDSSTATSATVSVTGNFHSGEDQLAFTNTNATTYGNISSSYNSITGVLTLTSSAGSATTAQWQAALEAVTYTDTAVTPNTATRTISFEITSDGYTAGNTVTKTVTVADTDQTPVVTTTGGTTTYDLGTSATSIDGSISVTDRDNTTQSSGTVSISNDFQSGDTLAFTNTSATTYGNISVQSYDAATGVLTLTSSDATATDAQWSAALSAVKFSTTSTTTGDRTISFATSDGTKTSTAATDFVNVVNPINVTADSGSAAFVAGDNATSTPVAVDSGLTVSDTATNNLTSATVAITGNFASGEDRLAFTNTNATTYGNIAASYSAGTGVLTLTSSSSSATVAQWQAALDAVTYTDTAITPNNTTRTISFSATDSLGNTSATATRTVTVTDTDQTPVVTTTGGTTLSYVGGTSAATIDGSVSVSDRDNTTQSSGTVSITSGFSSGDTLSFTNTSSVQFGNIAVQSYDASTGVLTLTSSSNSATDAQWASALSAVTFSSTSTTYGNRTVSFVTNDGTENSAAVTDTINITAPPTITADSGSASFVAGDNATSAPVAVDSGLTVTDGSASTLASATVSITGNFHSGEDQLAFTNTNATTYGNIAASYSAGTGVLTLTSSSNSATLAQWQAALDAVTYTDTAITPNNATRTISFSATDTGATTSNTATRTVTVTDTDQTPIVTTTGGTTLSYVGGTSAATIDGSVSVSDRDNTTQSSGTVSITSGFSSGDTLSFTNTSSVQFGNIAVQSYDASTGVLTLTSSSNSATDAQWASALSAVTFSSTSTTYGNRTVSFVTNDGTENSAAVTDTVDVLGPPTITTDSGSASFVAGDNATSAPVAVDSGLTVTDGSASTLASATVSITGNFHSGEDQLAFTNTNATTYGNIAASYSAGTGVLTLTSSSNSATLAQWQAALDAVTYTDTAITPNNTTRTISFSATDTGATTSNTATRTVTVTDTDQTPIVTTTGGTTLSYVGGTSAATIDGSVSVSDRDNTTQSSGTVSITSGFSSGDTLSFTNTSSVQFGNIAVQSYDASTGVLTLTSSSNSATDAQWASALSAVTFSSTSTTYGNRTVSFVTNDGTENSAAATDTINITAPPTITTDSGSASFVAGDNATSAPVAVDSGLTVTDGSASTLASATVSITGNFHSGEDQLAFTNTNATTYGNISASYSSGTGVLALSSSGNSATLAQWQAALDAVTYTDTAITPNNATRTVSFSVTDIGSTTSNTATRTVTVTDTDQTPVVTTTSGTTLSYVGGTSAATIDGSVTVTDRDNTTQSSGTVSITTGFNSGDTLSFTNTSSTQFGNIQGSYDASTGVLTLTSEGATSSDAQWADAFSAVTFSTSASATPGNRTISFLTNDGEKNSAVATDTVDVLGPPTITTDSGSASFVAGDNSISTPVTVDLDVSVTDGSASTLASATVAITGNFHSGEDVLAFTNTSSATYGNIAVDSYNASTGVLRLTSSGVSATISQWQAALEAVTYTDTAVTPNDATRTISFSVIDTGATTSNTATRTVTVTDTDQTPIVTTTGGTTNYVNGATATIVNPNVTVTDLDNSAQSSGTVSITSDFHSGDVLAFTNNGSTMGNISASYDSTTGVLTLTSSDSSATDAQWASALSAVTFSSSGGNFGDRTISFTTNDGTENSAAATATVSVLDAPHVTTDSGSASFVAGDNTTSTPIVVSPGLTLTDASVTAHTTALSSATVTVTGGFHAGQDVLAFTNDGSTMGNIQASYDASTGVLTLTSASNSASMSDWQAALASITYTDTAVVPNNTTRTISFMVSDSDGTASLAQTRSVTVTDTDQTPTLTVGGSATFTSQLVGSAPVVVAPDVAVGDRDPNAVLTSAQVTISSGFDALHDTLAFAGGAGSGFTGTYDASTGVLTLTWTGTGSASLSKWQAALESVTYSNSAQGASGTRTVTFTITDGVKTSAVASNTVTILKGPSGGPPTASLPLPPPPTIDVPDFPQPSSFYPTGSDNTAPPDVLTELGNTLPIGLVPIVSTMTFSDPDVSSSGFSLDRATVSRFDATALDATLAVTPSSDMPSSLSDIDVSVPEHDPFSIEVATLLPPSAAMQGGDLTVRLADGRSLPGWLHYDAANGVLRGKVPPGVEDVHIVVEVRDASGHVARREVVLAPHTHRTAHEVTHPHHQHSQLHPKANGHAARDLTQPLAARAGRPVVGKPSLDQQFAQARAALHVSRPVSVAARRT
ncbi:DUF4347 domain-containing protein [Trinickia acidisoli]|uniref:DUF4347 domain-containing protein n=1 Tax=Trinickia acidisoli TaxID=2767482 RepID=UPI001A8F9D5B|nr:DUF4347 domain-containing protein [Trinickia acidisoli]